MLLCVAYMYDLFLGLQWLKWDKHPTSILEGECLSFKFRVNCFSGFMS